MEPLKTNQTRQEWQYFHTIPTSCVILPTIKCVHRRVVEDSGVGSAGCLVHVHVHGE